MTTKPQPRFDLADILYESFYTAGVGGSVVALTFLLLDGVADRLFYTPSLVGQMLFTGAPASSVTSVSLKAVAYYTPVHFAAFFLVGLVAALLARTVDRGEHRPFWALIVLFCIMEGGFLFVSHFFLHGLAETLGTSRVAGANFMAAVGMVVSLHSARHTEAEMHAGDAEPLSSPAH